MFELDPELREDLERLREREGPSPATLKQMFAALELQLGDDPGPEDPGDDPSGGLPEPSIASPGAKLGFAAKVVGATVALTGAGLIALRLAVVTARAIASDPAPDRAPQHQRGPESTQAEPSPSSAQAIEIEARTPEARQPEPGSPPSKAPKRGAASKRQAPEPVDSLALELAVLEAAHAARGPEAALVELERHRQRFPNGQLADEREVLRVEAMVELGRIEAARETAARFLAARPNSPLGPRMRNAYAATDRGDRRETD